MEKKSLIFIKNYQALNNLVSSEPAMPRGGLSALIGRTITVFTDSGGASGRGFTGILCEVRPESIRLVTALPSAPVNGNRPCRRRQGGRSGTFTTIFTEHITAISYDYI